MFWHKKTWRLDETLCWVNSYDCVIVQAVKMPVSGELVFPLSQQLSLYPDKPASPVILTVLVTDSNRCTNWLPENASKLKQAVRQVPLGPFTHFICFTLTLVLYRKIASARETGSGW